MEKEAANFLLGEVDDPHIALYVNHVERKNNSNRRVQHVIMPEIHAMNFPAGKQSTNDSVSSKGIRGYLSSKNIHSLQAQIRAQ